MPVIEIRTYQLHEGAAERFHQTMHAQVLVLLRASGTDVLGAMASLEDPHCYMIVRAYDSGAARDASQAAFYGSDAWIKGPREAIMACIVSYHTMVVEATPALRESMRSLNA
ncbi:MAG: NIPSNAP family protein [Telluria sp.]